MAANYIKIFVNEMVTLERVDGSKFIGVIQSSKNDIDQIEKLSTNLQDMHEIVVTVKLEDKGRVDILIKIMDIHSIEIFD